LVQDSIEQRQHDTLKQKSNVAGAILDGEGINSKRGVDLTVGSLINFLTTKLIAEGLWQKQLESQESSQTQTTQWLKLLSTFV
jgi:hypothetical protein